MDTKVNFYREMLDNLYDGTYFMDREMRITYWNKSAERLTGYTSEEVLGRRCHDNILMHVDEVGKTLCHTGCLIRQTLDDGKLHEVEAYLHHKRGHRVPVHIRVSPIFDEEQIVGVVEVFSDNSPVLELRQRVEELQRAALVDALTGVGNRRFGEMILSQKLSELKRYAIPFSVILVDIDHFKHVNDTYGHDVGDRVLQVASTTMGNCIRTSDILCRWGGEEFLLFCTHNTEDQLDILAGRLRALVEASALPFEPEPIRVTVSVGATLASKEDSVESLLRRADQLMYRSKSEGRNRVTLG